jgi:hypothetical protein
MIGKKIDFSKKCKMCIKNAEFYADIETVKKAAKRLLGKK